jgi:hypothetical protein
MAQSYTMLKNSALEPKAKAGTTVQHRGKLWSEVDTGFLQWMLDKDFGEDEIFTAWHWINARNKAAAAAKEPA